MTCAAQKVPLEIFEAHSDSARLAERLSRAGAVLHWRSRGGVVRHGFGDHCPWFFRHRRSERLCFDVWISWQALHFGLGGGMWSLVTLIFGHLSCSEFGRSIAEKVRFGQKAFGSAML